MTKKYNKFINDEHTEQSIVVELCRLKRIPIFAIPNGTFLNGTVEQRAKQMVRLKKEGLEKGVPDLFIPYPNNGYCGLFIEMKRVTVKKPSKDQEKWLLRLNTLGYKAECCSGSKEAIELIKKYFKGEV